MIAGSRLAIAIVGLSSVSIAQVRDDRLPKLEPGVSVRVYAVGEGLQQVLLPAAGQTPNVSFVAPTLDLRDMPGDAEDPAGDFGVEDTFVTVVDGYLKVDTAGVHAFRLTSDDGSQLRVGTALVVDHDGLHGPEPKEGEAELAAGWHQLEVTHFEGFGGAQLTLEWRPPGADDFVVVPSSNLGARAAEVRVTSPGNKQVVYPLPRGLPGDGRWLDGVHPSYELHQARPDGFRPKVGGIDWLPDGRLVVCTWDAVGGVYAITGAGGDDPSAMTVTRIAAGLAEPLGLEVVDGRIFVLQKQELTELVDEDGDGFTDFYRCVAGGWDVTANFHEFAFGLAHVSGKFYANLAIAIDPGGASTEPQLRERGSVIEIDESTGEYRVVASGLRTPNGIGVDDSGALWLTDNQGDWLPCSKLLRFEEGAFFGNRSVLGPEVAGLPVTPPVVWLPQGEIGNSPGEPTPLRHGPYAGQMVHTDVTHGGLKRTFVEEVDGVWQGAVFRFTQGLEGGANRVRNGPDGDLYVGGIGSTGNWGQEGKERFGLQRLEWIGDRAFEPLAARARSNGFEVEFTRPLADGEGWDRDAWTATRWRYAPTAQYGGPKVDEGVVPVLSASVSDDRRRVFVELDPAEVLAGHVYHLRVPPSLCSDSDDRLWTTEAWYTLNAVPSEAGTPRENPYFVPPNTLTGAEREAGFELLFDGESVAPHWTSFGSGSVPAGWVVDDGAIHRAGGGGDLVTRDVYGDFELRFEWKVAPGANSGVMFRVGDAGDATYVTGPEYQILDNQRHANGRDPLTCAASNYGLHAPTRDTTRPAGAWNAAKLVVDDGRVEHWLNGERVVEYTLGSDAWNALVADSKFAQWPDYGRLPEGRIALQDHGDPVWFRDLRILRLE